ncbi:MAG TPA: tetratricopeptide repeat protein [Candidatus Dormibacteraeota bacterium]|nr:tetratricopeptide repeat protein [Candidatus Dormibacteraeota bacterium]
MTPPRTSILPSVDAVRAALDKERKVEQDFVEGARQSEKAPQGWPAALVMFHLGMWRERMKNALTEISEGREQTSGPPPPDQVNQVNDTELAHGIGTPLSDAAARSDHLLSEIGDLYDKVGERPIRWNESKTTTVAVLRNSYTHPRLHIYQYLVENGETARARKLFEEAVADMEEAQAPDMVMGIVLYNLATVRAQEGNKDGAIDLLKRAIAHRPEAKTTAAGDSDFGDLRDDRRFQELTKT